MAAAADGVESTGRSSPLGATAVPGGVNFSVFSRGASGVELLLFDRVDDAPARVIPIDCATNRTYHYWHIFVSGVKPGQMYGYRVHGLWDPANGMRFDPTKVLLDPYGRGVVVPKNYSRDAARLAGDNATTAMKSVVVDPHGYDWEGDTVLRRPSSRTIIYEMHVTRFHAPSQLRSFGNSTRHVCRFDREDSISPATRHHCRRTAACVSVRRPGCPTWTRQLLGICAGLVLRAAPRL